MLYIKYYLILVFSIKGTCAFPVLELGHTRRLHTKIRVSLLADVPANSRANETPAPTANKSEYEDPVAESSWICRYSSGNGGPCHERADAQVPAGRYCLPHTCCSKTVVKEDQMGMWCTSEGIFCNGLVYYKEYSFDECSCYKAHKSCHRAAICVDQPVPLRGVFCKCKEGYVGDGKTCRTNPCKSGNPCGSHGKCIGDDLGGYKCACNEGYVEKTIRGAAACWKKSVCEVNPEVCGPPEAVAECKPNGADFACSCKPGWRAPPGLNQKCEPVSVHSACADDPCGPEKAVLECIEVGADDYACSCKPGYTAGQKDGKSVCLYSRADPCEKHPCGKASIVEECTATETGYTCICKKGATLKGTKDAPHCSEDLSAFFAVGGVAAFFLVLIASYQCCEWRHKDSASQEENYDIYNVDYSYYNTSDYL